uniref:DNA-directed RNA polymerase n=1 Tax=Hyalogonium fusiforme TaxID=2926373 RepID=A0A9E7V7L8_9CHLO|nr:DNA-directed RNA polymerase subunit beta [Hyalogonium fusiforme]
MKMKKRFDSIIKKYRPFSFSPTSSRGCLAAPRRATCTILKSSLKSESFPKLTGVGFGVRGKGLGGLGCLCHFAIAQWPLTKGKRPEGNGKCQRPYGPSASSLKCRAKRDWGLGKGLWPNPCPRPKGKGQWDQREKPKGKRQPQPQSLPLQLCNLTDQTRYKAMGASRARLPCNSRFATSKLKISASLLRALHCLSEPLKPRAFSGVPEGLYLKSLWPNSAARAFGLKEPRGPLQQDKTRGFSVAERQEGLRLLACRGCKGEGLRSNPTQAQAQSRRARAMEYSLESFQRSNQDTTLTHKPAVFEGSWVQSGDLLTDCASSVGGELSLGQNILVAYMPWEGYNFEDAILISERLVMDDLYTSVHIERYDIETYETKLGFEQITRDIPDVSEKEMEHLDSFGIVKLGAWVEEGDILVGKVTPIHKKTISSYQKLLYTILEKQIRPIRDSSLRAPKGIKAKVIDIKYFLRKQRNNDASYKLIVDTATSNKVASKAGVLGKKNVSCVPLNEKPKGSQGAKRVARQAASTSAVSSHIKQNKLKDKNVPVRILMDRKNKKANLKTYIFCGHLNTWASASPNGRIRQSRTASQNRTGNRPQGVWLSEGPKVTCPEGLDLHYSKEPKWPSAALTTERANSAKPNRKKDPNGICGPYTYVPYLQKRDLAKQPKGPLVGAKPLSRFFLKKINQTFLSLAECLSAKGKAICDNRKASANGPSGRTLRKIETIHIYLAEKRKIQVGDKMAGRHGNKGIVSQILPIQDMPYLPDGTPVDMVLNPLGVPSRMNVGQIYECLLGLAGKFLGENYKVFSFDEIYGPEASRSFVFNKLYQARSKTGFKWLFDPNSPGKMRLYDGRTGYCFDQKVTVGQAYMLRLVHMVDDKIHCLTAEHDVLTSDGWLKIRDVGVHHQVATLNKKGELVYQNPSNVFHYHDYKGSLYHIKNTNLDLLVTLNHRMYVRKGVIHDASFKDYQLIEAKDIIGKHYTYLKNANWIKDHYQFILPSVISNSVLIPEKIVNMDAWLLVFGLCMVEGWAENNIIFSSSEAIPDNNIRLSSSEAIPSDLGVIPSLPCVLSILGNAVTQLGYNCTVIDNKLTIFDKQLWSYLTHLSVLGSAEAPNKSLPSWVWLLSQKQAQLLLHSMCLGDGTWPDQTVSYYTSSVKLADDVMRLALHAGWSGNKYLHHPVGNVCKHILNDLDAPELGGRGSEAGGWGKGAKDPKPLTPYPFAEDLWPLPIDFVKGKGHCALAAAEPLIANNDLWRISIMKDKNNPAVNHGHHKNQKVQIEEVLPYEGSVYCLSVPNQVFYVRRNGIPVWTGNSRSTGPYSLVTQQPLRGRSKQGGQRLGEMEVWAIEGYGAAFTLLEMLTLKSDDMTGRMTLWTNLILNKDISIGTPESFKVLICELQALCLDIGLFRYNENVNQNPPSASLKGFDTSRNDAKRLGLREITSLVNLP